LTNPLDTLNGILAALMCPQNEEQLTPQRRRRENERIPPTYTDRSIDLQGRVLPREYGEVEHTDGYQVSILVSVLSMLIVELWSSSRTWTPEESEALLRTLWIERKPRKPKDRTLVESQQHLQDILDFFSLEIPRAVDAYHEKYPKSTFSMKESRSVLSNPVQDRDEDHYYDLVSELCYLHGDTLEGGMHKMVEVYRSERAAGQQHVSSEEVPVANVIPWFNEVHLSPNNV
jgi:hypothetical protein